MDDKDLIIQGLQNDIDKLEDEPKPTHSSLIDRNCMRRLIDADVFWEDLCENAEKGLMQSDSIEEVLNRQPTINVEPKWIPVSERLPEEYKRVLVSDVFGVYIGEFVDAEENWGGQHFINGHGMHSKSVKAWMPLPEPYKGEQDGNR